MENMNYKQTLKKAKEFGVDNLKLQIANDMDDIFDETLCDEDFELCCNFIKQAYLKSDNVIIYNLCLVLHKYINNSENIKTTLEKLNHYDLIDEASWYE